MVNYEVSDATCDASFDAGIFQKNLKKASSSRKSLILYFPFARTIFSPMMIATTGLIKNLLFVVTTLLGILAQNIDGLKAVQTHESQIVDREANLNASSRTPDIRGWARLLRGKPISIPNTGYDLIFQRAISQKVDKVAYVDLLQDFKHQVQAQSSGFSAPYHCRLEIVDAPSGTPWTVNLDYLTRLRSRIPLSAVQETVNLILRYVALYGPASLNTLIQVPGRIGALTPTYSLRIHVDDSRFPAG